MQRIDREAMMASPPKDVDLSDIDEVRSAEVPLSELSEVIEFNRASVDNKAPPHGCQDELAMEMEMEYKSVEPFRHTTVQPKSLISQNAPKFDKRAKLIAKRFRLRSGNVQVKNLLWFAPPAAELHGVSLRLFHEWNPVRLFCAEILSKPLFQLVFAAINILSCVLL